MVDKNMILRKMADLKTYINQVKEYASISLDDYQSDWKVQRIVERTLQMAIEVCVDMVNHIIADRNFRIPNTYSEGFRILKENNIISEVLCENLVNMCKFRNVLVHEYDKVDPAVVIPILRNRLKDFDLFQAEILGYFKKNKEQ